MQEPVQELGQEQALGLEQEQGQGQAPELVQVPEGAPGLEQELVLEQGQVQEQGQVEEPGLGGLGQGLEQVLAQGPVRVLELAPDPVSEVGVGGWGQVLWVGA